MLGERLYYDYLELKLHFNQYNFRWKHTKRTTLADEDSYEERPDKEYFIAVESHFSDYAECIQTLISGFLLDKTLWIGDLLDETILEYHNQRMRRVNSLQHTLKNDISLIDDYCFDNKIDCDKILLTKGASDPMIINIKGISLETLSIFDVVSYFTDVWFSKNPLRRELRFRVKKYGFLLPKVSMNMRRLIEPYIPSL